MIALIVSVSSVVLPLIHLGLTGGPSTRGRVVHLLLLYALVLDVGLTGLPLGFIPGEPPGLPRFRCDPFARDVAFDPGRASAPRMSVPHMIPHAIAVYAS